MRSKTILDLGIEKKQDFISRIEKTSSFSALLDKDKKLILKAENEFRRKL